MKWKRLTVKWFRRHKLHIVTALLILMTLASAGISIYVAGQSYQDAYSVKESGYGDSGNR